MDTICQTNYTQSITTEPLYCGTDQSVLIKEVSSFHRWKLLLGLQKVFLFQSVLIRKVPLYIYIYSSGWSEGLHFNSFHHYYWCSRLQPVYWYAIHTDIMHEMIHSFVPIHCLKCKQPLANVYANDIHGSIFSLILINDC